jgi:hypothetical protein
MIHLTLSGMALAALSDCGDGQPFPEVGAPLPGTEAPSPDAGIFRYEDSGLVTDVSYNAANYTFTVDNLGFDGASTYQRADVPLLNLGTTRVFAADAVVNDPLTGEPISQINPYRALYGDSRNQVDGEARTSFAIVRNPSYGSGGFVYERNGGVVIPTTGQAKFTGQYAGVCVSDNPNYLEYTTGNMSMDIDFEGFNANDAVKGRITDRRATIENGDAVTLLPNVERIIGLSSALNENGEITSDVYSTDETGTFNGILAGDTTKSQGEEIVGIITLNSNDSQFGRQVERFCTDDLA